MRPLLAIMLKAIPHQAVEVLLAKDKEVIQAYLLCRLHNPLRAQRLDGQCRGGIRFGSYRTTCGVNGRSIFVLAQGHSKTTPEFFDCLR